MQPQGKLSTWLAAGLEEHRRADASSEPPPPAEAAEVGREVSGERDIRTAPPSDRPPPSRLPESYTRSRSSGARIVLGLVANPYKR